MGLKSKDREAMPLCWQHHRAFHDGSGPFDGWTQVERCLAAHALFFPEDQ
jgi:hypothetical protein